MMRRLTLLAPLALLAACAADDGTTGDEADLSATSGDFRLSLNVISTKSGAARVHGLANQAIESARAFIPDDEVGTTAVSPKSFISSFRSGEVRLFLNGRPAFFSVVTSTEAYSARADLAVKVTNGAQDGIKPTSTAASVLVNGAALVRIKGTFTQPLTSVKTVVSGADLAGTVNGKNWQIDCPIPFVADAIANEHPIPVVLGTANGTVQGALDADFKMKAVAITTDDAYTVWPAPTCTPDVLACIQQPANAVDTAACGDAFHVAPCWKQLHP